MRDSMKRGFTLVELLVAVSIFSVLIVTIYSSISSGVHARRRGEAVVDLLESGEEALRWISTELSNSLVLSDRGFLGRADRISFATLKRRTGSKIPRICHVSYYLTQGSDGTPRVLRRDCRILGEAHEEAELTACSVREIKFRYAYREGDESQVRWLDFWLGTEETPLPLAVEVTLELASEDETMTLTRAICIPVSRGLEAINAPTS